MEDPNSYPLDDLLEQALRARVIDHYDNRGLCVVIRCGKRTYTSSRPYARDLIHDLLRQASPQQHRSLTS